jgi:hypothetical protein
MEEIKIPDSFLFLTLTWFVDWVPWLLGGQLTLAEAVAMGSMRRYVFSEGIVY